MPKKRRIVIDYTVYSDSELSSSQEDNILPPTKKRKLSDTSGPKPQLSSNNISSSDKMVIDLPERTAPTFPATDFDQLSSNKEHYWRFLNNSNKAAAALFELDEKGNTIATQYPAPLGLNGEETPTIRPLHNIQRAFKYGQEVFLANTPNGTAMSARRFYAGEHGKDSPKPFEIGIFSPTTAKTFWGGGKDSVDFLNDKLDKKLKEELAEEFAEIETKFKGRSASIDNPSVSKRDGHKKRPISQNEVMARHHGVQNDKRKWDYSAKTHYEEFLDQYRDILSEEMIDRLKRSVNAALTGFKSHHRPEWLHAVGYTLTSMKENPQVADNLGANPKWANTQMMILEKIAKWFAMNRPESRMHIKPLFEMLLDSDIIHKLYFEVDVNYNNDYLRMFMDIHPFKKWPLFPKAYDMAFTTYYAHEKLSHATPLSQQTVTGALRKNHPASELHPSYEEISSTWATHKNQLKHAIGEEDALKEQDKTQPPCKQTKTMKDTSVHLEIERKEKLETNKVLADLDKILYGKSTVSSHASLDDSASSQLTGRKRPRTFEKSSFDPMQDDAEKDNMDEIIEELTEEPPRSTRLKRLRKR